MRIFEENLDFLREIRSFLKKILNFYQANWVIVFFIDLFTGWLLQVWFLMFSPFHSVVKNHKYSEIIAKKNYLRIVCVQVK